MVKLAKLFEYTIFKGKQIKLIIYIFDFFMFLNNYCVELNVFYILLRSKYLVIINKRWMGNYKIFFNIKKGEIHFKKNYYKNNNVK